MAPPTTARPTITARPTVKATPRPVAPPTTVRPSAPPTTARPTVKATPRPVAPSTTQRPTIKPTTKTIARHRARHKQSSRRKRRPARRSSRRPISMESTRPTSTIRPAVKLWMEDNAAAVHKYGQIEDRGVYASDRSQLLILCETEGDGGRQALSIASYRTTRECSTNSEQMGHVARDEHARHVLRSPKFSTSPSGAGARRP